MADPSSTSSSRSPRPRCLRTRWLFLAWLTALVLLEAAVVQSGFLWSDFPLRLQEFPRSRTGRKPEITILGTCLAGNLRPRFLESQLGGGVKVYNLSHGDAFALNWYLIAANHILKGQGDRTIVLATSPGDLLTPVYGAEGETGVLDLATWSDMPFVLRTAASSGDGALHLLLGRTWRTYRYRHFLGLMLWRSLGVREASLNRPSDGVPVQGGWNVEGSSEVQLSGEELAAEVRATLEREARALNCLKHLLEAARENQARVLLVPLPAREASAQARDAYVWQAIAPLKARILDVRSRARMLPGDFRDDRHLNLRGTRKFCRALARALKQELRLPVAGGARP